jgi:hypothetical protein
VQLYRARYFTTARQAAARVGQAWASMSSPLSHAKMLSTTASFQHWPLLPTDEVTWQSLARSANAAEVYCPRSEWKIPPARGHGLVPRWPACPRPVRCAGNRAGRTRFPPITLSAVTHDRRDRQGDEPYAEEGGRVAARADRKDLASIIIAGKQRQITTARLGAWRAVAAPVLPGHSGPAAQVSRERRSGSVPHWWAKSGETGASRPTSPGCWSASASRHLVRTTASASANYSRCQALQISSTHT